MRVLMGFALSLFLVILLGANTYAAPVVDHVVINEIMANPATGEVEWIELYNPTDTTVSMSGWRLVVTSGNFSGVFASDVMIAPHGYAVRSASDATSKLNNTSATITLRPSASDDAIDTVTYNEIVQSKSYARECDASDVWQTQAVPTKNATNCVATLPKDGMPPVINDVAIVRLSGDMAIDVAAADETTRVTIVARLQQYGAEIAQISGIDTATLHINTAEFPNGSASLIITATDEAGNVATRTFDLEIYNPQRVVSPTPTPVAQPTVVAAPIQISEPAPQTADIEQPVPVQTMPEATLVQPVVIAKAVAVVSTATTKASTASPSIIPATSLKTAMPTAPAQTIIGKGSMPLVDGSSLARVAKVGSSVHRSATATNTIPLQPWGYAQLIAIATGLFGISFALWRYLRRTKP